MTGIAFEPAAAAALPGGGVVSLLGSSPESWMTYLGFSSKRGHIERRFLLDATWRRTTVWVRS